MRNHIVDSIFTKFKYMLSSIYVKLLKALFKYFNINK